MSNTTEADLFHDFGENVPERDKYTAADMERFQEIAQSYGISKFAASKAAFNAIIGSNPYRLLRVFDSEKRVPIYSRIFPLYTAPPTKDNVPYHEEEALGNLGINYRAIKQSFIKAMAEARKNGDMSPGRNTALKIGNILIPIPGTTDTRTYEVSGVLMKEKDGAGTLNIASRFELLTGPKSDHIAMIIDASGGLSMTALLNSDLEPRPSKKMNFYILENIENESDSATKLKNFDSPKIAMHQGAQPNLHFLKDDVNTVLYPTFNMIQGTHDGEMLFGNADLVLSRAGDEMEADFTFPDNQTYHIENVSQNANVKNASLNIIASTLAKGGSVSSERGIQPAPGDRTPYLFPYIKRVGDWCQVLALMDMIRKYIKLNAQHKAVPGEPPITLEKLREMGATIGILTLDRILLGYALALGVDVFFTTATDLRLLLYFRNTETPIDENKMRQLIDQLRVEVNNAYAIIGKDNVVDILGQAIVYVQQSATHADYVKRLRGVLYRISLLRTDFEVATTRVNTILGNIKNLKTVKEVYDAYFEVNTLLRKLKADETHNETQRGAFGSYPALVEEKQDLDNINTRPASRGSVAKVMTILSKTILNDAKQTKRVFEAYYKDRAIEGLRAFVNFDFNRLSTTGKTEIEIQERKAVFAGIFKSLKEVQVLFGIAQRGGGGDITSLLQFVITPVATQQEYENNAAQQQGPQTIETSIDINYPLPLVVGSYYRDKKSLPYTVVDEYMITKEDLTVFLRMLPSQGGYEKYPQYVERLKTIFTAALIKFVVKRLIILYLDILQGELEQLVATEDEEEVEDASGYVIVGAGQPSGVKTSNHIRIYYKVNQLLRIYTTYIPTENYTYAFIDAINTYTGADLLDNAGLAAALTGADAPRDAKDYDRTFQKIKMVRSLLLGLVAPAPPPTLESEPTVEASTGMDVEGRFSVGERAPPLPKPQPTRLGPKQGNTSKSLKERSKTQLEQIKAKQEEFRAERARLKTGIEPNPTDVPLNGMDVEVGGGLRTHDAISTDVQGIPIPGVRSNKHSRLRKRLRTRRARKSKRKSKTR